MKEVISWFLKGLAMGTANVIPGVSGGTIALITGIFERLINAVKSMNLHAAGLVFKGRFADFARHTDLRFLASVFLGVGVAILSMARVFEFLFDHYPLHTWSFFFGLILASVYVVGVTVKPWKTAAIVSFAAGVALALAIMFQRPAAENRDFLYLVLSGIVAVCSMILPGLSGSFVLILMGNYRLVAIDAINRLDLGILLPFLLGMVGGLIAFSHVLSWLLKKFRNATIALLTGFILGSLGAIWPWKEAQYLAGPSGEAIVKSGKKVVEHYALVWPSQFGQAEWVAVLLMLAGIVTIWLLEKAARVGNPRA